MGQGDGEPSWNSVPDKPRGRADDLRQCDGDINDAEEASLGCTEICASALLQLRYGNDNPDWDPARRAASCAVVRWATVVAYSHCAPAVATHLDFTLFVCANVVRKMRLTNYTLH